MCWNVYFAYHYVIITLRFSVDFLRIRKVSRSFLARIHCDWSMTFGTQVRWCGDALCVCVCDKITLESDKFEWTWLCNISHFIGHNLQSASSMRIYNFPSFCQHAFQCIANPQINKPNETKNPPHRIWMGKRHARFSVVQHFSTRMYSGFPLLFADPHSHSLSEWVLGTFFLLVPHPKAF